MESPDPVSSTATPRRPLLSFSSRATDSTRFPKRPPGAHNSGEVVATLPTIANPPATKALRLIIMFRGEHRQGSPSSVQLGSDRAGLYVLVCTGFTPSTNPPES